MLQRLTGDITMILATQRPSLLRTADFVYELADKKGQIISMPSPPLKAVSNERAAQ
jgi:hypothetical protein